MSGNDKKAENLINAVAKAEIKNDSLKASETKNKAAGQGGPTTLDKSKNPVANVTQ